MNTLNAVARCSVWLAKSCVTPAGTRRNVPRGASIHSWPTRKVIVPSVTRNSSTLCSWWCGPGPGPPGSSDHSDTQ
jgi:hypothetical protein